MLDLSAFRQGPVHYDRQRDQWRSELDEWQQLTASLDCVAEYLQVSTATETREQAVRLARAATAARLVAGVQIVGPVTSVFWHLGEYGQGE